MAIFIVDRKKRLASVEDWLLRLMRIVSGEQMCEEGVGRMKFTAGQLKHIYIPGC